MSLLSTEFKVGVFTLAGVATLVTTGFILGGNPFAHKKNAYYTTLNNAEGVAARTQVRIAGVQVGEVKSVELLPVGAKITIIVNADVKIPKGSMIDIKARGILGDVYIEIVRNEKTTELAPPGTILDHNPETNDMQTLLTQLNSIARDVKKVTTSLADVFGSKEGTQSLHNIVSHVEGITADLHDVTSSQKTNIKETIQAIHDGAIRLSKMLERNDAKVDEIIENVKVFTAALKDLSTPENKDKINSIIANVDSATGSLKRLADKVEKGEGTIGQLLVKDETANEVKATLKSIQDVVKPISQLKLTITDRAEYRVANAPTGARMFNEFDLILNTRPDRLYLLGVTNAPFGQQVQTTTTSINKKDNTKTQVSSTNIAVDSKLIRFNLQVGQKFGMLGIRLGLFADTAGFATDVSMLNNRLVGSAEFSNFGGVAFPTANQTNNYGPFNLKTYVNYFVTNNLFVTGGVDGLVLYKKPFPFVGAGFAISDDEIKGILGIAAFAR